MKILAADIGGTHSRFGFFLADGDEDLTLICSKWFRTRDADSFGRLLSMLGESDFPLKAVEADITVIAIAGPVAKGTYSAPPLIPWHVDLEEAGPSHGLRHPVLINDFIAQAYATRSRPGRSSREILPGERDPEGTVAVIGAGTGLGKAALIPNGPDVYTVLASEGGHASFPFLSGREAEYQEFLLRRLGEKYVTGNNVVSGKGISLLHEFLTGDEVAPENILSEDPLLSPPGATRTIELAARFYGRVCRNFALETLALGGLYVAGGVAAKSPVLVTHEAFASEFRSSVTMAEILSQIPVSLMTDEESGLWGGAALGTQILGKEGRSPGA
ncbi:MAG: glucokinase [Nitrospiraceae bacterium]|nr:glucokinase [Nitrospiraceae bacterium]